ncbi:MAG: flagellar hook protein FlgE [Bacillota bacterium]|nr:MAG: flagellar hook protein FlgE [Bacillota bacterium]MBS3951262.1 flagellar hook protein FlgE [Peptococcaceae bacterium]
MLRSLFAAISGMRSQQTKLDVTANNIANVGTTGFKGSRVKFQDMLSQTIRSASAPMGGRAGINPSQVGLGMTIAGIDTIHTQGSLQATGRVTDLAIQGGGLFVVSDGVRNLYTRDGSFSLSLSNELVNASTGLKVVGWMADNNGQISTQSAMQPISIPVGEKIMTKATALVEMTGNLSSGVAATAASAHTTYVTAYDSKGASHELTVKFTKTAANAWNWGVTSVGGLTVGNGSGTLSFTTAGALNTATTGPVTVTIPGAETVSFSLDFNSLSQVAGDNTALVKFQDGYPPGELLTFSIGKTGVITGTYSNGLVSDLGQIALAYVANPEGMLKSAGNLFDVSSNSGEVRIGAAGSDGRGTIETGMLEMSNVDLATEFTEMISTSRAFQANSRVVTTSDEMLQELIQLKR